MKTTMMFCFVFLALLALSIHRGGKFLNGQWPRLSGETIVYYFGYTVAPKEYPLVHTLIEVGKSHRNRQHFPSK